MGAELSENALGKLRARGLEGVRADLEKPLPFDDGAFAVTMCLDVLEHVFATDALAAEVARVTAPDGDVFIAVPNGFNLANRLAFAAGRHIDVMDVAHRTTRGFSEHVRFFSEPVLERCLADAGLRIVGRHYYFPGELTDSRFRLASSLVRLVTVPRLHERLPSLFALAFLVHCRKRY